MTKRSYPFGYCCMKGEIVIDEKEGEVVKRIFEEYAEGRSLKEIADRLNEQGIAFKTAVSPWHKSRVHHLLTDGRYIGEKNYPPLIERELFERIARLRENKYGETEPVSEAIRFLQKNVVCGACGSRYVRKLGKKGGRYYPAEKTTGKGNRKTGTIHMGGYQTIRPLLSYIYSPCPSMCRSSSDIT